MSRTAVTIPTSEEPAEAADQPEIEFVILAERAEILNGKLYMMGGGYDRLFLDWPPPQSLPITFAVGLLVPLEASRREHHLQFAIRDEAGNTVAASDLIGLNIARPTGLCQEERPRVMLAPLGGPVTFPSYGMFTLHVTLNGAIQKTIVLHVLNREGGLNG
jgi:hypothetical protein